MAYLKYILLCLLFINQIFSDYIEVISYSEQFIIDTTFPDIEVLTPSHGDNFGTNDIINITWEASDHSPALNPMTVYVSAYLDNPYTPFFDSFPNTGSLDIGVPPINTIFASIRLDITDYYGNISSAYTSGYFTLGNANEEQYNMEQIVAQAENTSSQFGIDTKAPVVDWIFPNQSANFDPLQGQVVRWSAFDENIVQNPITLSFVDGGVSTYILAPDIINNGMEFIQIPDISTLLGHFKVTAVDSYGNSNYDLSDNYMYVGNEDSFIDVENESTELEAISSSFTIDTKVPNFLPISTTDAGDTYFYPNGGEIITEYASCPLNWSCDDDSFDSGTVTVSLAYLLGGWYLDIGTFSYDNYSITSDLSLNGIIDETLWARLLFTATDDYGNQHSQYNDDYFVLGDSEGDLDINWVDEETDEIMINWGWEAKHSIMIRRSAISEYLQPGDIITLVDNMGIPTGSCDDEYGYTELKEVTINDDNTIGGPKSVLRGIDHCSQQGQRRGGFVEGNSIIFKITKVTDATTYFVSPDTESIGGNITYTSGGHTVIRSIDFANPITIDNYNPNYLVNNERDFDSFNVYYKVNAANLRDCNPAALGNNDSNGDGQSDANWCYDTTVYGETDYLTNVPGMTQSSILTYRVWLMNNTQQEVFRTVDTSMEINIELSDLYDKSLSSGWNWFSLNMTNTDMGINNILSSLESSLVDGDYIKSQGGYADFYLGFGWFGTLESFDNTNMYKLDIDNPGNITFEGTAVDVLSNPLELSSGWNWVSYLPQEAMDINVALASIVSTGADGDYMKSQGGYADYYPGFGWFGTLETLSPRAGYMLDIENISTLTYPESGSLSSINNEIDLSREIDEFNYQNFAENGSVTIALDLYDITPQVNDEIRAIYNDEIRGISKAIICPINDNLIFPMMMYSNNSEEELTFKYYNNTNQEIDLLETILFVPDMHLNNAIDPYVMTNEHPITYALTSAYPNPFNPSTTISYSIADDINNLNINIYDIQGRFIDQLHSGKQSKGEHQIIWNASSFASGIYFIHMLANNHQFTKKIILVK
jgi:hypothetical protein